MEEVALVSRKLTPRQAREMAYDIAHGMTKKDAAAKYGIGYRTVFHYLSDHEYGPSYRKRRNKQKRRKRELQPCGTDAAYRRHVAAGEIACVACVEAHNKKAKTYRKPKRVLKGCGTNAGWAVHRRAKEEPCDPCRIAHNEYNTNARKRRKLTKQQDQELKAA